MLEGLFKKTYQDESGKLYKCWIIEETSEKCLIAYINPHNNDVVEKYVDCDSLFDEMENRENDHISDEESEKLINQFYTGGNNG